MGFITWAGCLIGVATPASAGTANPTATETAARNVNDRNLLIFIYSFSELPRN
jgi:hypothetical protein